MKLLASKILTKLAAKLTELSRLFYIPIQEQRCIPWFSNNGDKTLRLQYDLDSNAIVFDLGGYEGQWASDIFSMHSCYIHIFEPVDEFASNIKQRFSKNAKIFVHQYGLSNQNRKAQIFVDGDSSSILKRKTDVQEINLVKAIDFINDHNIGCIDLMKINIEGGEYELLEHFLENGFIKNVINIQVQFHDFVPNAMDRMIKIQNELAKTHNLTYQYPFVWENWKINTIEYPNFNSYKK